MSLWKELFPYALRHNVPVRGFSGMEIASFLKSNGLTETEKEEIKIILRKYDLNYEDIPFDRIAFTPR